MKSKFFLPLLLFFLVAPILAQEGQEGLLPPSNSFNYGHCLEEVFFYGIPNSNYLSIRKDDDSDYFTAPQFTKKYPINCLASDGTITKQAPVAYVSGTKAMVKAVFQSDCTNAYYIRGKGPSIATGQINFPKQKVTPSDGQAVYKYRLANLPFVDGKVKHWEDFTITWEVSETGDDDSWVYIDESKNPLYVTRGVPETVGGQLGYNWFHTLFKVSCESADGETSDAAIINKIWNKLKTKSIIAADNKQPLHYYEDWVGCGSSFTTKTLLAQNDGQCGSWARFFIDLLKIQKVTHSTVDDDFYHFSPQLGIGSGFLVKDWTATIGPLSNIHPDFKYTIIPKQSPDSNWFINNFMMNNTYNYHYSDLKDNTNTIAGQGPNGNPQSIFNNHQIAQINSSLKDPSYGFDFSSLDDIENKALFGYFIFIDLEFDENDLTYDFNGDGQGDDLNGNNVIESNALVRVILVSTNKNVTSLIRTPSQSTNH